MTHLILAITLGVSFAWFAVEVAKWHLWFGEKLNFKPFNCPSCLGAWTAYFCYFLPTYALMPLTALFLSGTIATFLTLIFEKIK